MAKKRKHKANRRDWVSIEEAMKTPLPEHAFRGFEIVPLPEIEGVKRLVP